MAMLFLAMNCVVSMAMGRELTWWALIWNIATVFLQMGIWWFIEKWYLRGRP